MSIIFPTFQRLRCSKIYSRVDHGRQRGHKQLMHGLTRGADRPLAACAWLGRRVRVVEREAFGELHPVPHSRITESMCLLDDGQHQGGDLAPSHTHARAVHPLDGFDRCHAQAREWGGWLGCLLCLWLCCDKSTRPPAAVVMQSCMPHRTPLPPLKPQAHKRGQERSHGEQRKQQHQRAREVRQREEAHGQRGRRGGGAGLEGGCWGWGLGLVYMDARTPGSTDLHIQHTHTPLGNTLPQAAIEAAAAIPAAEQRLIFKGKVLKDEQPLKFYGGCTPRVVVGHSLAWVSGKGQVLLIRWVRVVSLIVARLYAWVSCRVQRGRVDAWGGLLLVLCVGGGGGGGGRSTSTGALRRWIRIDVGPIP